MSNIEENSSPPKIHIETPPTAPPASGEDHQTPHQTPGDCRDRWNIAAMEEGGFDKERIIRIERDRSAILSDLLHCNG